MQPKGIPPHVQCTNFGDRIFYSFMIALRKVIVSENTKMTLQMFETQL